MSSIPNTKETATGAKSRLGPVETSILEYVLSLHCSDVSSRAALISLLMHAQLLARGARICSTSPTGFSVINVDQLKTDPIRLSYTLVSRPKSETLATTSRQLQLSVVETDAQIFVSLTDTVTDKFGHAEFSGIEHVCLDDEHERFTGDICNVFPHLNELLDMVEQHLLYPVLPSPPLQRPAEKDRKKDDGPDRMAEEPAQPRRENPFPQDVYRIPATVPFPDYGRSDLDPFSGIGSGGMLLDPRRPIGGFSGGALFGGPESLSPGAVPPGARFDPFGPGVVPNRPFRGPRRPDPDHALPPGFEDMYL